MADTGIQLATGNTYLVMGDLFTILATGEMTGGAFGSVEVLMQPQGFIPPHFHDEEEAHYLLEGELEYQVDDKTIFATPGTFIHMSKGQVHSFRNHTSQPVRFISWATPAGSEQFFPEVGQLVQTTDEAERLSLLGTIDPANLEKAIALAITKYGIKFLPAE